MKQSLLYIFLLVGNLLHAQQKVSGTVFDKSKSNRVERVKVVNTSGATAYSDSMGRFSIPAKMGDSLFFVYGNKPTQRFAVSSIANVQQFDVSLHVNVPSKYTMLKEVQVYSKTYRQDSLENREMYADVFDYRKPGLRPSIGVGGSVGFDANEIINVFRFKRNRQLKAFQQRIEAQEKEKYVNYRFNKLFVGRITGLRSPALDTFLVYYRPNYAFAALSSEIDFNKYVLDASYQFRKLWGIKDE